MLSFGDDDTLHTELDFQFVLPEPKTFNDQSTQTNENEIIGQKFTTAGGIMRRNSESLEYFSASDDDDDDKKSGKRFRTTNRIV